MKITIPDGKSSSSTAPVAAAAAADSDVELASTVPASSMTELALETAHKEAVNKLKMKIVASLVLGLSTILASVLMVYMYYYHSEPIDATQFFQVVLRDPSQRGHETILLNIKVDPTEQIEYMSSPVEGKENDMVIGIKDFNRGTIAYKERIDGDTCYIGQVSDNSKFVAYGNGSVQEADVMANKTYVLLNTTIHPFVLNLAAGPYIVAFCGDSEAVWMIPYEDAIDFDGPNARQKRCVNCGGWGWGYNRRYIRRCWWDCSWWGWNKFCSKRCWY